MFSINYSVRCVRGTSSVINQISDNTLVRWGISITRATVSLAHIQEPLNRYGLWNSKSVMMIDSEKEVLFRCMQDDEVLFKDLNKHYLEQLANSQQISELTISQASLRPGPGKVKSVCLETNPGTSKVITSVQPPGSSRKGVGKPYEPPYLTTGASNSMDGEEEDKVESITEVEE